MIVKGEIWSDKEKITVSSTLFESLNDLLFERKIRQVFDVFEIIQEGFDRLPVDLTSSVYDFQQVQ